MISHVLHPSVVVFAAASLLTFSTRMMADSPNIVKVAVTRGGEVTANGKRTTLEDLDSICRGLAEHKGKVWYYREAPKEEPHPIARKVLDIIIRYDLPVRLSSKPDYSDSINDKGESVPPR
jgi:hypothetical protein